MIAFAPDPPPDGVDFATAEWVLRQLVLLSQSATATEEQIGDTGGLQDQIDVLEIQLEVLATTLSAHVQNVTTAHDLDALQSQVTALAQLLSTHVGNMTDAHGIDATIELEGV